MATIQPLLTPPTTLSTWVRASVKNVSLNSAAPVSIWMGRTSTPGWSMGQSRKLMPRCLGASGSVRQSTKIQLADWPAEVQIFWPLMTHSSPSRTARQPRLTEVGAGVGLGVALAPDVGAVDDAGQEVRLLLVGADGEDGVADHLDAERVVGAARGGAGLLELLGEDDGLELAQAAAAVLARPRRGQVALLGQQGPPGGVEVGDGGLVGEGADAGPCGREVLGQEGLDLLAVRLGLGGIGGLHDDILTRRSDGGYRVVGRQHDGRARSRWSMVPAPKRVALTTVLGARTHGRSDRRRSALP